MTTPTKEDLEKLLAEVTPGPWHFFPQQGYSPRVYIGGDYPDNAELHGPYISVNACYPGADTVGHDANARLIALAPTIAARVIALDAENARLRTSEARLREALTAIGDLASVTAAEFKARHPKLNADLDKVGQEQWGEELSWFAHDALKEDQA